MWLCPRFQKPILQRRILQRWSAFYSAARPARDEKEEIWKHPSVVQSISELRADITQSQNLPKSSKFHVVEIEADGTILELAKTPFDMRLQPRDVSLFTSDTKFSKQRATIAARDGIILFRTETCKAIISPTRATLFPLKSHSDTVRLVESVLSRVMTASVVPFEFRVLESMLEATIAFFEKRAKRVRMLLESVVAEINAQHYSEANVSEYQRLLPIRRALTEMLFDVKETREAIAEAVDNENILVALCLTEQIHSGHKGDSSTNGVTKHMKLVSALLDSYERQVETVEGALKEMQDNMDDTREVWHMQMDSNRNRIIRINLTISIASFSLLLSTLPAGFFGMNLINGLETTPGVFSTVVYSCLILTVLNYIVFYGYYRYWPERKHQQRLTDMKALKDILSHHIDGIDDLLSVLHERRHIGRIEFDKIVNANVKGPQMTKGEVDLLYRIFYTNRDGLLEAGENLISPYERLQN
eukprot:g4211.t1